MGNHFSTLELKTRIANDLKIDVAFPFFPAGRHEGSAVCCVVDTEWIEKLSGKRKTHEDTILLKSPAYTRHALSADGSPQKQSPTVNIYVNMLSKYPSKDKELFLYQPTQTPEKRDQSQENGWPPHHSIRTLLEEKERDHTLESFVDSFEHFSSLFHASMSAKERHELFVDRLHEMLWPNSRRYKIISREEDEKDHLRLQQRVDPRVATDTVEIPMGETEQKYYTDSANSNLPDVFAIVESESAYYFLATYRGTTLQDLITYNPGVLSSNFKKGFIVYQLLRAIASLHSRGVLHGGLKASNILIDEHLWIQLAGIECGTHPMNIDRDQRAITSPTFSPSKEIPPEPLVIQWIRGEISNYSYIMILNHLAGRKEGDPNFHPIMPWVVDFTGNTTDSGWRDFTKTKFRMNKGDEQLDFTFDGPVPHHITDILSDITYYVYLARKTPIPVLCQFVRSKYEPNEYPSSMQRLYQWTPDECIPEFYTDPSIFKSIHSDMPDLQVPLWADSPEDFVKKHAEALESDYVSSQLHHWIDLTFGNNLTGKGAVKAKNVALPLLAGQNSFMKHGIIQLFKCKHPQRGCNWNNTKAFMRANTLHGNEPGQTPASASFLEQGTSIHVPSLRSSRTQRHTSISLSYSGLPDTSSNAGFTAKERAASVHSTTSSVDTYTSMTSRTISIDPSSHPGLTSVLRTEPIRFPLSISDDFFTENLTHYEETCAFSAKHKFINEVSVVKNPILPDSGKRFNIEPWEKPSLVVNPFFIGAAEDVCCLGKVIQSVFAAGNTKVLDLEGEPSQTSTSGYFEVGNGDVAYDIAPTGRVNVSSAITHVIASLMAENWEERPTAKAILCASFPVMSVRDPTCSFPFPEHIPEMYEYLAAFYQAEWSRRLYLADKWIERICDLEDEAFLLILPTFTQLFTHSETRVGAISLFPKLAQRLGPEKARHHLLKPVISMFETLRPKIPKVLFDQGIVREFVKQLGIATFLQQMLPCYLEALAINEDLSKNLLDEDTHLHTNSLTDTVISPISTSPVSVSELAGEALVYICKLLGPILTSKHIVRQLVKIVFRDNSVKPVLLETVVRISSSFGETFTSIQYAYLISLIDTYQRSTITVKNCKIICSIVLLLEQLLPYMQTEPLVTEFKSGFMMLLYKLLEPLSAEKNNKVIPEEIIRLRLTISMRTIDYLLQVSYKINKQDWETIIMPMLQKYFSGFSTTVMNEDETNSELPESLDAQKNYQMIFAYSRFCTIVGKETMHRLIPSSDAIEAMMFYHFSSGESIPLDLSLSIEEKSSVATDTIFIESQPRSNSNKIMAWMMSNKQKLVHSDKESKNAAQNPIGTSETDLLVDSIKLYQYSTKDLHHYATLSSIKMEKASSTPSKSKQAADRLERTLSVSPTSGFDWSQRMSGLSKVTEKESKSKVPTSVLPWKTKWKPCAEDKKNWNRFLSTNSEEMSKIMQFSFNDLKLRGFAGHTTAVRTITVNEPAKLFASGSRDRTVKLWSLNAHDGIENWENDPFSECLMTYSGHRRGAVNDVHFLSGGLGDIVASCDGHVHLWDPETGKAIHQFSTGRSSVVSMKPIFHSRDLVGGTMEGNVTFFDVHNQKSLHTWKSSSNMTGTLRAIAVNRAETLIAIAYSTGAISLLESRTGTLIASWKGGDTEITMIKFYTDELLVSCAPTDHIICCWNVSRLALVKTIPAPQDIASLDLFKDEILTINANNSVSFIPINDDFQSYSSAFKSSIIKSQVSSFAIVPADQLLLFGCTEGEIFLYA
ncbi:hypothetical protein BDF14DRAFT_1847877 [Spinellus fusiger]|nr:hypothetical protein BDF14DRAFT_1847877 [Spinellus fusiger]